MTFHVDERLGALPRRPPVFSPPGATLRTVAHTMWAESIGMVVVGDARHPRGVISERDIVAALAQGADPDTATAADAMTNFMVSARSDDALYDAAAEMIDSGIRHLPIVDASGAVTAMVSVRDLLPPLLLDALGGGYQRAGASGGQ